jgi:hypothetical protein
MASMLTYTVSGDVWSYRNPNEVFFVSLPRDVSDDILDLVGTSLNPWGTVPCRVIHGDASWESSMFPRKDLQCYDLPLNAAIRKRHGFVAGMVLTLTIEIELPM